MLGMPTVPTIPASASALPATIRLAPHRTLLRLGPTARMIGLDPATALVVEDLEPALARMLDALTEPVDRLQLVAEAAGGGADPDQANALLHHLLRSRAILDAAASGVRVRRRSEAVVLVVGDGPLAVGIAAGLARGGVGAVHVGIAGTVVAADLGTGYLDADRGHERGSAAAAAVHRLAPSVRTGPLPQRSQPDVVVLADALVPDADQVAGLMAGGTAHLLVRLRDGVGLVGPLVLPGRSACLRCLDLHRLDRDPDWYRASALLAGRTGQADPECAAATAALGTAQTLAALDGGATRMPPPVLGATLRYDPAAAALHRQPWAAHPGCPCRATLERRAVQPGP